MHPILSSRNRLAFYVILWLGLGSVLSFAVSGTLDVELAPALAITLPPILVLGFINLSIYFLCRANPISERPAFQILLSFAIGALVTSGLWVLGVEAWHWFMADAMELTAELPQAFTYAAFATALTLYGMSVVTYYLLMTFDKSRELERKALESRIQAQDAELRSLRAQIDPHFLFNSLNSISALTSKNPQKARDMIIRLSDFFRASLNIGHQTKLAVRKELELIDNYLDLEKIRLGDKLVIEKTVNDAALDCVLPPLILQPLVENAIKHGISKQLRGGRLRISVSDNGVLLAVTIENTADSENGVAGGLGLGLQNVRDRLLLVFGEEAVFRHGFSNGEFFVHFQVPSEKI